MASEDALIKARRDHAKLLDEAGCGAYPTLSALQSQEAQTALRDAVKCAQNLDLRKKLPHEADIRGDEPVIGVYGRVVAKRGPFIVLRTPWGDIQALVRSDKLSDKEALQVKALHLADLVIVEGRLMQTRTGDAAIRVERYQHASKALVPPPEKWHGLTDVEKRYRERYVDLYANPDVNAVFHGRSLILQGLRDFLNRNGYLEVETPILQAVRGGALAKPFHTHHNALDMDLYLRVAPELYLKRLLVGGLNRVYELGRTFRNEGVSTRHNPEFTILEHYTAFADCNVLYPLTERMLIHVDNLLVDHLPQFKESRPFTLSEPWKRISMRQAIADAVDFKDDAAVHEKLGPEFKAWQSLKGPVPLGTTLKSAEQTEEACRSLATKLSPAKREHLQKCDSHGDRVYALFEFFAEPLLALLYRSNDGRYSVPVFINEFPASVSPLARKLDADPEWVDRFELFIHGQELANAFTELNDPDDQAERFQQQLSRRDKGDEEAMDFDHDYIRALLCGMPPAAGFGIGVDRLVMLLCQQDSIRDVLLFPLLRP